jgi:CheY-like chemotaxis protein
MCKILIVDDEADIREFARVTLSESGHEVCEACDGRAALELLTSTAREPPCLVLVDLRMPLMDGWDFVAAVRGDERWKDIRIVVFSATIEAGAPPPLLGAHAYWSKPPSCAQFERIHEQCSRHSRSWPPEAISDEEPDRSAG